MCGVWNILTNLTLYNKSTADTGSKGPTLETFEFTFILSVHQLFFYFDLFLNITAYAAYKSKYWKLEWCTSEFLNKNAMPSV